MAGAVSSTIGLLGNLLGVILLFRYGMPYRIPTPHGSPITTGEADPAERGLDARHRALGFVGLVLIIVGTAFQVAGTFIG